MGLGMLIVCTPSLADTIVSDLHARKEQPLVVGEIVAGHRNVIYA
jgi:phosphoribosylaminoimidazole (AIR) synthetase